MALAPQTLDTRGGQLFASPRSPSLGCGKTSKSEISSLLCGASGVEGILLCPTLCSLLFPSLIKVTGLCQNSQTLEEIQE